MHTQYKVKILIILLLPFFSFHYAIGDNYYLSDTRAIKYNTVLFVPQDPVKKTLIDLINNEKKAIWLAQFKLSDKDVIAALCNAHRRGVVVRIIIDSTCLQDKYEKISWLLKEKIKIRKYITANSIMHHKFIIFFKNGIYESLVWTGSANTTTAGLTRNKENVIIFNDPISVQRYMKEFESLYLDTVNVLF